jgi:hypothetical protein
MTASVAPADSTQKGFEAPSAGAESGRLAGQGRTDPRSTPRMMCFRTSRTSNPPYPMGVAYHEGMAR